MPFILPAPRRSWVQGPGIPDHAAVFCIVQPLTGYRSGFHSGPVKRISPFRQPVVMPWWATFASWIHITIYRVTKTWAVFAVKTKIYWFMGDIPRFGEKKAGRENCQIIVSAVEWWQGTGAGNPAASRSAFSGSGLV